MERNIVDITPGSWIALEMGNEGMIIAQVHASRLEIPPNGRLLGTWAQRPDPETVRMSREI